MKICNLVTSHEAGTPGDRIQQILTLPASASRLDATISAASNVEELMVASSAFPTDNFPFRRVSRHNSPTQHKGRQGRSPFRQQRNADWKRGRNGSFHSPNGSRWFKRSPSPWRNSSAERSGRGNLGSVRNTSQQRDHTPRRREWQSPGGRWWKESSRSPGKGNEARSRKERGRSLTPKGRKHCIRCGDSLHSRENCPIFPYYSGKPYNVCKLMHDTKFHRNRSSSGRRDYPHKETQSHQVLVNEASATDQQTPWPNVFKSSGYENIFGPKN